MDQAPRSPVQTVTFGAVDQRRIDVAADMFRLNWESGKNPAIERFLEPLPDPLKAAGFERILEVEIRLRRLSGENPAPANYARRFPQYAELIRKLFDPATHSQTSNENSGTIYNPDHRSETSLSPEPVAAPAPSAAQEEKKPKGDLQDVPTEFGRYQILSELGRGGMGTVYLAVDRQLDRKVALKIPLFRDEDNDEPVERFYREAKTMATLQHANLCPVYDVGRFEKWHFLTMAFIDGQPLSAKLKREGPMSVIAAVNLLKTLAAAVQKAHDARVIHRDLKPANIMLNKDEEPVIMDFGLARRRLPGETELTQSGAVFGSPAYMAPEQVEARHQEIGPATDIYALGVILYQCITGRRPFEGSVASVFGQIVSSPPVPPIKLRPGLPAEIDQICMRAMAKSPADRHSSAAKLAEDLSNLSTLLIRRSQTDMLANTATFQPMPEVEAPKEHDSGSISRSRREAELRQVTVAVFSYEADEASISINKSSHSELLHEQSHLFSEYVTQHIEQLGGVTVPGSGTEVIACFGFPQAFEDAPQRAVRVALQVMRDLAVKNPKTSHLPTASQIWCVLHSGEAVAEELDPIHGKGISLVGEARNTAMRLNAIAEQGAITISSATHQRVAVYFECESLGQQRVRGMSQAVNLFKVIKESASRNRVELTDPGNLSPLVGRDTELSILKDRWEQALEGLGQIVLLIGDAGLGKSRLIRELREHVITEDTEQAAVIEWRCSQYQQGTSFFPVVEFLSRLLDFENNSADDRQELVVKYLRDWKIDTTENVSLMCGLLGVPTDERFPPLALSPQKMKERTERLLLQWLQQLVSVSPLLFIVEDLHWLDPSTLELLEKYVFEFQTGRMLSILTFRPEFETPWKSKPHQTQIALNRLTKRQIGEMMRKRTRRKEIPEPILKQVIERTEGIPLFVEEFTVVIVESGILDRADSDAGVDDSSLLNVIPATLNDLLLSRLDRMAADREVIHLASTIGREFSFGLLAAACSLPEAKLQEELQKLLKAEILFQKGESQEAQYIFKHALLQDAAYRSMLTKKRQACHQRIADAMEDKFPDIVNGQPALLAHHFTEAGINGKAVQYWLKAGRRSQEQSANVEAISHLTRGLKILQACPESLERDQMELALQSTIGPVLMAVKGWSAPEVGVAIERAQKLVSRIGAIEDQFFVIWGLWGWRLIRSDLDICLGLGQDLMKLVDQSEPSQGLLPEACWVVGSTDYYRGDFTKVNPILQLGLDRLDLERERSYSLKTGQYCGILCGTHIALSMWQLGQPDQALKLSDEMVRRAKQIAHPFTYAMALFFNRQILEFSGRHDQALASVEEEYRVCHENGFLFFEVHAVFGRGVALLKNGKVDGARELFEQGLKMRTATGGHLTMDHPFRNIGDAFLGADLYEEADTWLERGLEIVETYGQRGKHSEFLRLKGNLAKARGDESTAEVYYKNAIEVARAQSARSWELRTAISYAELLQRQQKPSVALEMLQSIYNTFTEGFATSDLIRAKELMKELAPGG